MVKKYSDKSYFFVKKPSLHLARLGQRHHSTDATACFVLCQIEQQGNAGYFTFTVFSQAGL